MTLFLVLLVSCNKIPSGERPQDTAAALRAVQSGTQGVEIQTLPNYPPPLAYDQNELVAMVEVRNRGNFDLESPDCFIQVTGFDRNIIRGGWETPRSCAENLGGTLEGKSVYNTEGSFNQIEFHASSVVLPENVFEYSPTLNFVTCYNYHTKASPLVCVDPLFYQITSQQKSCIPKDVGMGGGQGAPIGVTHVGVDMTGQKAIFEIDVANLANGRVISPDALIQNCGVGTIDYEDLDRVRYSVQLSGGTNVDCKPRDGVIRLNNGRGKIVCSALLQSGSAYETPLLIDLDYGYVQSLQKSLRIIKTPQ